MSTATKCDSVRPTSRACQSVVEPLAQLQAESEVGDLEQDGLGHPFRLARPTPPELVHSRHLWRAARRWDTRRVDDAFPEVRYARSGDVNIAYQVLGDGPASTSSSSWAGSRTWRRTGSDPRYRRFLASGWPSFARLILFDKRGIGPLGSGPP